MSDSAKKLASFSPSSSCILVSLVLVFYCQIGWEVINMVNVNRCTSKLQQQQETWKLSCVLYR